MIYDAEMLEDDGGAWSLDQAQKKAGEIPYAEETEYLPVEPARICKRCKRPSEGRWCYDCEIALFGEGDR